MGVLLGVLTAVSWGSSDFVARFATHKIGALRTSLYMQMAGFVLLSMFLPWMGGWGHLLDGSGWQPWAWSALAGILNGVSTLSLYRSFEIGKMAVVAPLSASYPALTVALSVLTGEHLNRARFLGIACVVAGAALVAAGEKPHEAPSSESSDAQRNLVRLARSKQTRGGVGWALCSSIGFGFLFWLLGTSIIPSVGYAATVWMIRLTSSILTAGVILLLRQPISLRIAGRIPLWLAGMGVLDTGAFVMSNYGMRIEQISVVSVLSSLYGAVTVGLAAIFLRERISRWQSLGIAAIFFGIFLISR
ncbi:MAG TPA: DMT family transporter [Candidatus Acidoferrum sp.]|nr:DMT family transporter [Candidatus Acidoferrum sp.]